MKSPLFKTKEVILKENNSIVICSITEKKKIKSKWFLFLSKMVLLSDIYVLIKHEILHQLLDISWIFSLRLSALLIAETLCGSHHQVHCGRCGSRAVILSHTF